MPGWLDDDTGTHTATAINIGPAGTTPTFDTNTKKFGSSSAKFVRASNEIGGCIRIPDHADFTLSNTWSISLWFYPQWSNTNMGLFCNWDESYSPKGGTFVRIRHDNFRLDNRWWMSGGEAAMNSSIYTPSNNNWNHLALSRDQSAGLWRLWLNGQQRYSHDLSGTYGGSHQNTPNPLCIGIFNDSNDLNYTNPFNGYIDAFHIEDGVSNWSSNFDHNALTQPTVTAYSKLLLNFNENFYQVQGTLSDEARVTVIDSDSRAVEYDAVESAGAYAVDVDDNTEKTVIAQRTSDGKVLGYGLVTPTLL